MKKVTMIIIFANIKNNVCSGTAQPLQEFTW